MTKVLIIRFSSIGDIVLTTPVIRNLKEQMFGGVEVHYITKKAFAPVLEANPHISRLYTIDRSTNEILAELRAEAYDYVIDLHNNLRSSILKKKLGVLNFTFNKLNFQKWLLVRFGLDRMPAVHIVDRYMDTLRAFGIKNDGRGLDYFLPEGEEVNPQEAGFSADQPFTCLVIGAAHWRKTLPQSRLVEICDKLSSPVVLLGGPEDREMGEAIATASANLQVINQAGLCSLNQSASWIKQAAQVITGDTGMMHVAAAFRRKIISFWAATVPAFGMYPYQPGEGSQIIQPLHLTRRPCSKLGTKCKYRECRCREELPMEEIFKAAELNPRRGSTP